jgi:Rad3-related DNA helicase
MFKNIPNGVLFMFPSYKFMNSCYKKWQNNFNKPIFIENKNKKLSLDIIE